MQTFLFQPNQTLTVQEGGESLPIDGKILGYQLKISVSNIQLKSIQPTPSLLSRSEPVYSSSVLAVFVVCLTRETIGK